MLRVCYIILAMIYAQGAAYGQSVAFMSRVECLSQMGHVYTAPDPARGCLFINMAVHDFTRIRDALTPEWNGYLTCSPRHTQLSCSDGEQTCTEVGQHLVDFDRTAAALCGLSITLREFVANPSYITATPARTVNDPDIGGGDSN